MAVENWIDKIAKLWATIEDGRGGFVRSYSVFEKDEFPESLSRYPCALTYIARVPTVQYSASGPGVVVYRGVSEFHLTANVKKNQMPYVIRFYDRIMRAAAGSVTLGGAVSHFLLAESDPLQPGILTYGDEAPHYGIAVNWVVKENPSFVVGA